MRYAALVLIAMALRSPEALAAFTFTFEPAAPTTADVVRLRMDTTTCFLPVTGVVKIDPSEPSIEVEFHGTDTGCDPSIPENMATPRFQDIGMLPPGNYATRVYTCGFGPDGTVCGVVSSGQLLVASHAQYNLHTIPVNPPVGTPFAAAFDSNECEAFLPTEPATPATVTVQGTTIRLEVDRISAVNCGAPVVSHILAVPALPAGNYQLELYARSFQALPGSGVFAESIALQVGPAAAAGTFPIPANAPITLILLGAMLTFVPLLRARPR